jgi:hypothetical protein
MCEKGTAFSELRILGILRTSPVGNSANFVLRAFWEVRREPVLPLPGGWWHEILAPSHLTTGDNTQEAGSVENERGRERMSEGSGKAEMEHRIVQRSIEDDAFRQRLLEDPKTAVEQELGSRLPEEVRVVAVEETADTIYLVLPSTPMAGGEGGELSDQQLESVAGAGWFDKTCQNTEPFVE